MSDITVLGRVSPSFVIEDIRIRVALNETVTIPSDKAHRSKDLWRAISQGHLFQLKHGPPKPRVIQSDSQSELQETRQQNAELRAALEEQNRRVEALIEAKQHQDDRLAEQTAMLQKIVGLLESGVPVGVSTIQAPTPQRPLADVPIFVPERIRDESAKARIDVREDEGSGVGDASSKLRELRKGRD